MSTTTTSAPAATQEIRRHPIRGALWGLLLGLGIAIYAVLFALIPFGDWIPLLLCVLAGVGIGLLWAYFAPAKQPKDAPPGPEPAVDDAVADDGASDEAEDERVADDGVADETEEDERVTHDAVADDPVDGGGLDVPDSDDAGADET